MKEIEIRSELKKIHEEFINTLFHQETKDLVRTKTFFAGGCIRDMLRDKSPKDYDLYFYDIESANKFKLLAPKEYSLRSTLIENFNSKKLDIQVITILSNTPDNLISQFDFTINQGYYCPQLDVLKCGDLGNDLLMVKNCTSPFNALVRVLKFLDQGYNIGAQTLVELGLAVNNLPKIKTEDELNNALKGISTSFTFKKDAKQSFKPKKDFNDFAYDDIPF